MEKDGGWWMADGRWQMADGRWQMADGRWQMADGRWQMVDEKPDASRRTARRSVPAALLRRRRLRRVLGRRRGRGRGGRRGFLRLGGVLRLVLHRCGRDGVAVFQDIDHRATGVRTGTGSEGVRAVGAGDIAGAST